MTGPGAPFPCYRETFEREGYHPGWTVFVMRERTGDGRVLDLKEAVPAIDLAHPYIRAMVWSLMDARMEEAKLQMIAKTRKVWSDERAQARDHIRGELHPGME